MDGRRISILGAAVLLAAFNAAAKVVYVDPPDTVVTLTAPFWRNLLELDLDGNGQWDYVLQGSEGDGGPGSRLIAAFGEENWFRSDGGLIRGFRAGEMISLESGEWSNAGRLLSTQGEGEWAGGEERFLGFFLRVGTPSEVLGWIRLRALAPPVEGGLSLIVYDYAYEDERRNDIRAGEGTVPVHPTTWGAVKHLYIDR